MVLYYCCDYIFGIRWREKLHIYGKPIAKKSKKKAIERKMYYGIENIIFDSEDVCLALSNII